MSTEARDEAVEVMAQAIDEASPLDDQPHALADEDWNRYLCGVALDALTKPRTGECPACGPMLAAAFELHEPCSTCSGSGTVTRGPIAVLASELELVGWINESDEFDGLPGLSIYPVSPMWDRVYRFRGNPPERVWYCPGCKVTWTDENDLQQVQPDGHNACPICEDRDDLRTIDALPARCPTYRRRLR